MAKTSSNKSILSDPDMVYGFAIMKAFNRTRRGRNPTVGFLNRQWNMRKCRICAGVKPRREFPWNRKLRVYYDSCKECLNGRASP